MKSFRWRQGQKVIKIYVLLSFSNNSQHGLQTPREEIAFTARPKIQSQSQIFRYDQSIFCLPHRPNFSDISDLFLHWVSLVRGFAGGKKAQFDILFLSGRIHFSRQSSSPSPINHNTKLYTRLLHTLTKSTLQGSSVVCFFCILFNNFIDINIFGL